MDCMENCENIEYLWHHQPIFFIFSPCVWENNGLLNKSYWDELDIIDQGHSKGNVWQCVYISAILGPILTIFRQQ